MLIIVLRERRAFPRTNNLSRCFQKSLKPIEFGDFKNVVGWLGYLTEFFSGLLQGDLIFDSVQSDSNGKNLKKKKNCKKRKNLLGLGTHLFVKVRRPGDSEAFRSSSQAATCYYQSNHSKIEAIPFSVLLKDTTSKLAGRSSHYPFFMLNVKQGSCEY